MAGKEILGQQMSLETLPVDSPWRDRIKDWKYPDGKTEYQDGKQSPDEILEIMRESVKAKVAADAENEEMTDKELDAILDEILAGEDDEDEDLDDEESDEDESEEEEEDEDLDDDESDEDESEEEEEDEEEEDEEEEDEEEEEDDDEEEEEIDPEEVASQIAELKEQIESFRFTNISDEDIEE